MSKMVVPDTWQFELSQHLVRRVAKDAAKHPVIQTTFHNKEPSCSQCQCGQMGNPGRR